MSAIYGSIAGVFVLMLWLNLISIILLIGNEVNAIFFKKKIVNS
jgi:membrane protein